MFVIGTAGHIDHGKSSLINRLTGIDPDRLPEEKQRGMTIDLGFAWYDMSDGRRIGIVDVPGHERFVRNMIAGAGGIDAVILVVAADDGWMPQSQEHLQITKLLGVKCGLVVITKIDLVEKSWVDLVEDDLREKLKGSFLEKAPIIKVSSITGEGFDILKLEIEKLAGSITSREDIGKMRLYIDRAFVLAGMGGVVTGTLRGGVLRIGQDVAVFRAKKRGKIRTIQSHNQHVEISYPGQRTAVSLTGIEKEELARGNVISLPEIIENYPDDAILALSVSVIREAKVSINDRRRLLMILGTTEVEGEIRLFEKTAISPGENGILFFRPFEPVFAFIGDRFIVRLPTPQITIGGGIVLDVLSEMPRRKDIHRYIYLEERKNLTCQSLIQSSISKSLFVDPEKDFLFSIYSISTIMAAVDGMIQNGICQMYDGKLFRSADLKGVKEKIITALTTFFEAHPHIDGLSLDEIALLAKIRASTMEMIIRLMHDEKLIVKKKNRFDLPGREIEVRGELKRMAELISAELLKSGFTPPLIEDIIGDNRLSREAFDFLVASGDIVKIGGGLAFHRDSWRRILKFIRDVFDSGEQLTVSYFREKLASTRKYVVPILEETDRVGITERQGDIRIKGAKYDTIQSIL